MVETDDNEPSMNDLVTECSELFSNVCKLMMRNACTASVFEVKQDFSHAGRQNHQGSCTQKLGSVRHSQVQTPDT